PEIAPSVLVTVSVAVPVLPSASCPVTVITFEPCWSGTDAVHAVIPLAAPLPPRLFAQVTCVTPVVAVPAIDSDVALVENVGFEVGVVIVTPGIFTSTVPTSVVESSTTAPAGQWAAMWDASRSTNGTFAGAVSLTAYGSATSAPLSSPNKNWWFGWSHVNRRLKLWPTDTVVASVLDTTVVNAAHEASVQRTTNPCTFRTPAASDELPPRCAPTPARWSPVWLPATAWVPSLKRPSRKRAGRARVFEPVLLATHVAMLRSVIVNVAAMPLIFAGFVAFSRLNDRVLPELDVVAPA